MGVVCVTITIINIGEVQEYLMLKEFEIGISLKIVS